MISRQALVFVPVLLLAACGGNAAATASTLGSASVVDSAAASASATVSVPPSASVSFASPTASRAVVKQIAMPSVAAPSTASVPKLSPAQKQEVKTILTGSIDHYAQLLAAGKKALGTKRYASAMRGLEAFHQPGTPAAAFGDWRASSNAERDLSFMQAFKKADSFYTAANEPPAIGEWQTDMSVLPGDFNAWANTAAGWQVRSNTSAELAKAETQINDDLAAARADTAKVLAAS